jgi:hypothetical protein
MTYPMLANCLYTAIHKSMAALAGQGKTVGILHIPR